MMKTGFAMPRWDKKRVAVAVLAVVGVGIWLGKGHSGTDTPGAVAAGSSRPALTVRTTMLREDKWTRTLFANGSIIPWQEAVITAQVQGLRIADVKVGVGDIVKQGEVLVTLDNYAHVGDDGGSRAAQGRIVAPDAGVISAANANVGTIAQPGMELFRLIRQGRLEWRADLTADELMLVRKGMVAEIQYGEGQVTRGTVRAVSPSVNQQTRYGYALVTIPDSNGIIAGAFARGSFDISGGKRAVQTLPLTALMQRGSKTYVLVVGEDQHVHEVAVATGQRSGDRVQIKQGLKADAPVVESGGAFLTEGDVVQMVKG